ncbi:MAG TPA: C10 family peptidase [Bacteroidales bacterium]|nr:C10 family peptidase [Bacteroidales bacterium]
MKRILFCILTVLFIIPVKADKVDLTLAKKAGMAYFYEHAGQFVDLDVKDLGIKDVYTESEGNIPLYYIINLVPKGFIIVAADDNVIPVIGYSYESGIDPLRMPENLKYWMSLVRAEIVKAITQNIKADENISSQWNYYSNCLTEQLVIKKSKAIAPLCASTWNQDTYYNQFCPAAAGGPDEKAYAGCVATAMGQIMYYYRYPLQGQGSHGGINFGSTTYQWDNMLDDLTNYNEAVATLLYHCGKAVDMDYAFDGSSANATDCPYAFENYFKYNSTCNYATKYLYTTSGWQTLLKNNLDARHPMIYSGGDGFSGGHAWVCDGYDASNNFHMNWGWSGAYNGYFALNNLTAGGSSFNDFQGVVEGIYPPTANYPYNCAGTKSISGITGTVEDGSGPGNYTNNKDCFWLIDPVETVTRITLTFTEFATEAGYDEVTVYDGSTTAATVLGTFSGTTLPANVVSTGPQMLIRFTTDGNLTNTGWKATYKSSFPSYCNGISTITTTAGTIADGSGTDNYTYNQLCRWRITPPAAQTITLNFTAFNLANNDYLKVFDQTNNNLLDQYSGTSLPSGKTYNTGSVLLYFKTDGYLNAPGFSINFTSTGSAGLEENGNLSELNIFPNPAHNELNIEFSVNQPENIVTELCSLTGTVVYRDEQNGFYGNFLKTISVAKLSQGVYLLRIKGDSQSLVKKVVIE